MKRSQPVVGATAVVIVVGLLVLLAVLGFVMLTAPIPAPAT